MTLRERLEALRVASTILEGPPRFPNDCPTCFYIGREEMYDLFVDPTFTVVCTVTLTANKRRCVHNRLPNPFDRIGSRIYPVLTGNFRDRLQTVGVHLDPQYLYVLDP